ncbi:MAG: cell envelope integrity EipB family protein [Nitratireductor sp.]
MNRTILAFIAVSGLASIFQATPAMATGFEILAPHRAVYDLKLDEASERSGIQSVVGRIVYEVTGNECDGMSVRYRFVTTIATGNEGYKTDQQTSTFESPDGKEFTFLTKSFVDERPESVVKGTAIRTGEGVKVDLSEPEQRRVELPSAIFLSTHLIDIIEAGRKGETFLKRDIFDGSDLADEVVASSTVIGAARMVEKPFEGEDADAVKPFSGVEAWPVTISYFNLGQSNASESLPVYEASFLLYPDGISRRLVMRYPDYSLIGEISALEILPRTPCVKQQ